MQPSVVCATMCSFNKGEGAVAERAELWLLVGMGEEKLPRVGCPRKVTSVSSWWKAVCVLEKDFSEI